MRLDACADVFPSFVAVHAFVLARVFIVAPRILGFTSSEHFQRHTDDHSEPDEKDDLECQERGQEGPFDVVVPAHQSVRISERLDEMIEVVRHVQWSLDFGVGALITSVADFLRNLGVDGVAHEQIQDVAGNEPDQHECDKCDVAGCLEMQVFEDFCQLCNFIGHRSRGIRWQSGTHR